MTGTMAEQKETTEQQPEIDAVEITSATEVLFLIIKTSKALRMYLDNNPVLHRFLEELKTKFAKHLDEYGELKLDIDQFNLKYKGKRVYENRESRDSLAFRMHSDGIRSLIFTEGIEEQEIRDFLEIIGTKSATDTDDDIVTLLWIKDLPHIVCILAEDYLELDADGVDSASTTPQHDAIKNLSQTAPSAPEHVSARVLVPQEIISPTEEEFACLKKAKEVDESRTAPDEVMDVLFAIMSVEKDISIFGEFAEITVNLISNLIRSGSIDYALAVVQFLKELSGNETLSADHRDRLAKALESAISADIIKDLEDIITTTDEIHEGAIRDILLLFGRGNIKQICELLAALQKTEAREVIIDVLVALGKDSPEVFYPYLRNERLPLVRDTLVILRKIGCPASLGPVSMLTSHGDPNIRKEVLLNLAAFPGTETEALILRFLQDEIGALRILAIKTLALAKCKDALKPIREMVLSKKFDEADIAEKKALFEAFGELGADEAVPLLKDMLLRKYWFNKAREEESVTLAVLGLKKVKTDAALKALEEGIATKRDDIKIIIARARKGMEKEKARMGVHE